MLFQGMQMDGKWAAKPLPYRLNASELPSRLNPRPLLQGNFQSCLRYLLLNCRRQRLGPLLLRLMLLAVARWRLKPQPASCCVSAVPSATASLACTAAC
jgi:hypothetical protein